jgi:hypothetical protein
MLKHAPENQMSDQGKHSHDEALKGYKCCLPHDDSAKAPSIKQHYNWKSLLSFVTWC